METIKAKCHYACHSWYLCENLLQNISIYWNIVVSILIIVRMSVHWLIFSSPFQEKGFYMSPISWWKILWIPKTCLSCKEFDILPDMVFLSRMILFWWEIIPRGKHFSNREIEIFFSFRNKLTANCKAGISSVRTCLIYFINLALCKF